MLRKVTIEAFGETIEASFKEVLGLTRDKELELTQNRQKMSAANYWNIVQLFHFYELFYIRTNARFNEK